MQQERYVVYVEDEALFRAMVTEALANAGYHVITSKSPKEAIEELFRLEVQGITPVVLSDLVMPSSKGQGILGGLELVEKVRAQSPGVQVVMTTGYRGAGTRAEAYRTGVRNIVLKPEVKTRDLAGLQSSFDDYIAELRHSLDNIFAEQEAARRDAELQNRQTDLVKELVKAQRDSDRARRLSLAALKSLKANAPAHPSVLRWAELMGDELGFAVRKATRKGLHWEISVKEGTVSLPADGILPALATGSFEAFYHEVGEDDPLHKSGALPGAGSLIIVSDRVGEAGIAVHDRGDRWLGELFLACLDLATGGYGA
jgi:DNA-binding NarL/FixJ family response regulator